MVQALGGAMMKELQKALHFKDREKWRSWLSENHDKTDEIWLIHYKKSSGKKGISLNDAVEEALCFGWIDGKLKSIDEEKYILRYTPRKKKSPWSLINKERALRLIEQDRMTAAGMSKIEEARRNGLWDNAYSTSKMEEVPADLEDSLAGDEIACVNFYNFAPSYRNNYIGWINAAKTKETRKRHIAEVVKRARLNKKPGVM
jgi:uncharacterized protein YdeI (YjbR/CyaY-like superfamily)